MKTHKGTDLLLIATVMMSLIMLTSGKTNAQHNKTVTDFGFELSGGIQNYQLASTIYTLDNSTMNLQGGSIGFNFGNAIWEARIKPLGFYTTSQNTLTKLKLTESSAQFNFYPLKYLSGKPTRFPDLYLTGGVTRGKIKVNGYFLPDDQTADCIYEDDTFSGSFTSWNMTGGVGISYKVPLEQGYIRFFTEIKKGFSAATFSNDELLRNTSLKNATMVNLGIAIGVNQ
jgi:hypothetical protein